MFRYILKGVTGALNELISLKLPEQFQNRVLSLIVYLLNSYDVYFHYEK